MLVPVVDYANAVAKSAIRRENCNYLPALLDKYGDYTHVSISEFATRFDLSPIEWVHFLITHCSATHQQLIRVLRWAFRIYLWLSKNPDKEKWIQYFDAKASGEYECVRFLPECIHDEILRQIVIRQWQTHITSMQDMIVFFPDAYIVGGIIAIFGEEE